MNRFGPDQAVSDGVSGAEYMQIQRIYPRTSRRQRNTCGQFHSNEPSVYHMSPALLWQSTRTGWLG